MRSVKNKSKTQTTQEIKQVWLNSKNNKMQLKEIIKRLENPTPEQFLLAFDKNELMIDMRMHLKKNGGVRNHGTAFRISEKHLLDLYAKSKKLI